MFGISTSELVVIAFIAILIFGPERVPEFFHRAGKLIRGLQDTADDVWTSLQTELNEVTEPLREAESDIKKLGGQIVSGLSGPPGPDEKPGEGPDEKPDETDEEDEAGVDNGGDS
ncbi:MAG: twin-arginine translocase TatA/TatE family subunit [Acidimicrobiia bacterium]